MRFDGFRVEDSQQERARLALEKYGYSAVDFEWVHTQGSGAGSQLPKADTVYVIYRPTGFRRMYDGPDWGAVFEEDLKNHIFNPVSD